MAALKKQLEEAQRLKDQVEKSKAEAEKARIVAEKERDEAEQKGYDLGVAETEETLRAEVPAVCCIYCAQTWDEALNRAGVEASSELRKAETVFYLFAIRASDPPSAQGDEVSTAVDPKVEVLPQDPPLPSQQVPTKEHEVPKETSLDKAAKVPQDGAASQSFEQALASTTLPAGEVPKEKEKVVPPEATDKAPKSKLQIKLKP